MGLFSSMYEKEGKGVSKDAGNKKSFVVFFEIYVRKFWQLCVANMLYFLVNLPVLVLTLFVGYFLMGTFIQGDLTAAENVQLVMLLCLMFTIVLTSEHTGLAQLGLTRITRSFARERSAFVSSDFFDAIKKNWKQGLLIDVIMWVLEVLVIFAVCSYFVSGEGIDDNIILLALSFAAYFVLSCMRYYIPMMVITFKLKTWQILKNAVIFTFAGVWRNLLLFVVTFLCMAGALALLAMGTLGYLLLTVFALFIYPAFRSLLVQYTVFPVVRRLMIDPYYEDKPLTEDLQLRRDLGLIDEEALAAETGEEAIFTDTGATSTQSTEEQESNEAFKRSGKWRMPENPQDDEDSII